MHSSSLHHTLGGYFICFVPLLYLDIHLFIFNSSFGSTRRGKKFIRLVINQTQKHFTVSEHVHLVIEHLTRMSNSPKLILTQFLFYVTIMKGMPSECSCIPMDSCYLTPSVGSNFLSGSLWAVLKVARCCRYLQLTQEALHFWRVLGVLSKLKKS